MTTNLYNGTTDYHRFYIILHHPMLNSLCKDVGCFLLRHKSSGGYKAQTLRARIWGLLKSAATEPSQRDQLVELEQTFQSSHRFFSRENRTLAIPKLIPLISADDSTFVDEFEQAQKMEMVIQEIQSALILCTIFERVEEICPNVVILNSWELLLQLHLRHLLVGRNPIFTLEVASEEHETKDTVTWEWIRTKDQFVSVSFDEEFTLIVSPKKYYSFDGHEQSSVETAAQIVQELLVGDESSIVTVV
jgi:hypothetical protein